MNERRQLFSGGTAVIDSVTAVRRGRGKALEDEKDLVTVRELEGGL
ncbi:hypothetical protein [Halobacillus litoralis]|nr:hypothetical protein [Halobacillus litoralis]